MKIRITKGGGWYEDKVGEVFEVIDAEDVGFEGDDVEDEYFVDHPDNEFGVFTKLVRKDECEVFEEDAVNSPSHYTQAKFETIEVIEEWTKGYEDGFVSYCVGNALKYLARAPYKHEEPSEDLRKAAKYIEFALNSLAKEDEV